MVRIALTGPSGSGKGYVCALFEKLGVPCLDTDAVVHALYREQAFSETLSDLLGADVSRPEGGVDRAKLGALVYADPQKMETLLAAVYPLVRKRADAFLEASEKEGADAAVVDAPQLFEAGMEGDFDVILAVDAPKALRLARVMRRDGISRKAALLRFSHQKSGREYRKLAHHTLINDGKHDLEAEIRRLLARGADPSGGGTSA